MTIFHSVLCLLGAADLFLWWRSARLLPRTAHLAVRLALHGFFLLQTATVAFLFEASITYKASELFHRLPLPFLFVTYLWHLALAPLALVAHLLGLAVAAATGTMRWITAAAFRSASSPVSLPTPPPPGGLSRRKFLGTMAALTPPLLTIPLSLCAEAQSADFRIRRFVIPLHGLPEALDGMTIAHLSDFHIGQFTHSSAMGRVVEAVNAFHADLVVFTGDLINSDFTALPEAFQILRALHPAPVLCEGNHDVGYKRDGFETRVKAAGFRLLADENLLFLVRGAPVQLLGLRWEGPTNWQNRHDESPLAASMRNLLQQRIPGAFPILLAHHPHAWDYCGDIPLTLSGHTHGGQLMLDAQHGFGPLMFRYWSGLYTRPAASPLPGQALVVSNGIGNWFPLRANAPAELLHLTLRRA